MSAESEVLTGPPHAHHWDPENAYEGSKLGMWLFLATEILLFGGLFTAFALYRWAHFEAFQEASTHLNWIMGGTNTLILIFSSFTAALAVDAAQHGNNRKASWLLITTIACGFLFLIVKYIEYSHKAHIGLFPFIGCADGQEFCWGSPEFTQDFKMYFGLYYCMTGLHALHVIIGMAILAWVLTKSLKNRFSPDYYTPVEMGALYWHLVDLIWIYLFPLLYLVD